MKKILLNVLSLIAVAAIGFYFFLKKKHQPVVNDEIKKRLVQLVEDGSRGLYHLEMDSLEANVIDARLTLFKAKLIPDTIRYQKLLELRKAPPDLFEVSVDQFTIDNISPVDFLTAKEVNLKKLIIRKPVINVYHRKTGYMLQTDDTLKTVYERIQHTVSRISLDTIFVEHANFTYHNLTKHKVNHLDKVSFLANDFLLDKSTQTDTTRFLFAKDCRIRVEDYKLFTADSLYRLHIPNLVIETAAKMLRVDNLRFAPRLAVPQFYKVVGHQQDRFTLTVNSISLRNIDWWSMIGDEFFEVKNLNLEGSRVEIYSDKSMPPDKKSKFGKYPHQLLMKLTVGMKVDTTHIKNMDLIYTELNPKTHKTGTLSFNKINAEIYNITNDSATIHKKPFIRVNARAKFMNEASLTANFLFDLKNVKKGNFEAGAKLGPVSADAINKLSVPLGSVKIESLNVHGLQASIKGDNSRAQGLVTFEYDHLKISVLKAEEDTLKKRKLLSFLANSLFLANQNPNPGKPVRVAQASFQRDVHRSFFNLVWKTIFTGTKISAGYK